MNKIKQQIDKSVIEATVKLSGSLADIEDVMHVIRQSQHDLLKVIREDMIVQMAQWHGTGRAMVEDYFNKLDIKE